MTRMFSVPVGLNYKGRDFIAAMGPFERSMERDFVLATNKRALEGCNDVEKLREVAINFLEGWSNMEQAVKALVKENLELRQAMQIQERDIEAAAQLLDEINDQLTHLSTQQQSSPAKASPSLFGWLKGKLSNQQSSQG